ncbi:MAG: hypothetical protein ABR555_11740 [Pyrinomonadaceae bacterium]
MNRDAVTTTRLEVLLDQLLALTRSGVIHWERQHGSAHRYARWKNNLLILGPAASLADSKVPRYLFITPFDSPACVELNTKDADLGDRVKSLVELVESVSVNEPATDPFALTDEVLGRLT